jgi:hypothetical protein
VEPVEPFIGMMQTKPNTILFFKSLWSKVPKQLVYTELRVEFDDIFQQLQINMYLKTFDSTFTPHRSGQVIIQRKTFCSQTPTRVWNSEKIM